MMALYRQELQDDGEIKKRHLKKLGRKFKIINIIQEEKSMSEYSKKCKGAAISIIILGTLAVIMLAVDKATIIDYYEKEFDAKIFFTWLTLGAVFIDFFSVILYAMSELLENIAKLLYAKTASDAKVGLNTASAAYQNEKIINNGGWKCDRCGRVNASYISTCVCGGARPSK